MTPKIYLYQRKVSIREVAEELGCSREHLTMALNGQPMGKALAKLFEAWSKGEINRLQLLYPEEFAQGVPGLNISKFAKAIWPNE